MATFERFAYRVSIPVEIFPDNGFVKSRGFLELVLLHEEDVGHVEFPGVALVAKLHRLPEDLLHLLVHVQVPIDLRLGHQHLGVKGWVTKYKFNTVNHIRGKIDWMH